MWIAYIWRELNAVSSNESGLCDRSSCDSFATLHHTPEVNKINLECEGSAFSRLSIILSKSEVYIHTFDSKVILRICKSAIFHYRSKTFLLSRKKELYGNFCLSSRTYDVLSRYGQRTNCLFDNKSVCCPLLKNSVFAYSQLHLWVEGMRHEFLSRDLEHFLGVLKSKFYRISFSL